VTCTATCTLGRSPRRYVAVLVENEVTPWFPMSLVGNPRLVSQRSTKRIG
jgi:hypothetical protein